MKKKIKVNLKAIESMLYFWHAMKDREKVAEKFIYDFAAMPEMTDTYDEEFDEESVRRSLSAIKNRETFSGRSKKESRFWNNCLWMLEDLSYTDSMVQPLKQLNLDDLPEKLDEFQEAGPEELEVVFAPLHLDDYMLKDNRLIINFYKTVPEEGKSRINGQDLKEFILDKLKELLTQ